MLPTFRFLLATIGMVALAVAIVTYGLVPTPEVRTRIGEVPSISRSLIQEAMAPRLAIQALGDPAEEHAAGPDATGMAMDPAVQPPPAMRAGSVAEPERMTAPPAPADDRTASSDPLRGLIGATMQQTPEPLPAAAEAHSPEASAEAGVDHSVVHPGASAALILATAEPPMSPAPDAASLAPRPAESAAADNGNDTPPASSEDGGQAKTAQTPDATPATSAETAQTGDSNAAAGQPPMLALDDESNGRGNAQAKPEGALPAAPSVAPGEKEAQPAAAAEPGKLQDSRARRSAEKRATAKRISRAKAKRRAVHHRAAKRSRDVSSRKSRKSVRRTKSPKNRTANSSTSRPAPRVPRRGVSIIVPQADRSTAVKPAGNPVPSPAMQYPYPVPPPGYRFDGSAPAGTSVAR